MANVFSIESEDGLTMREANNGRLTLWFKEDPVDSKPYKGQTQKDHILGVWKRVYGPGFAKARVEDEQEKDNRNKKT